MKFNRHWAFLTFLCLANPTLALTIGDSGVELGLSYKIDATANVAGGLRRDAGALGNLDLTGTFDLEKILGAKALRLDIYLLGNHGAKPTEFVGDAQGTSNIEAPSTAKLYSVYLTQGIADRGEISLGLMDLNADFYATETLGLFRNSSFGIGPSLAQTGTNGPSIFPTTAAALVARYTPPETDAVKIRAGIFNATAGDPDQPYGTHVAWGFADGSLIIAEAQWNELSLGVWGYTKAQAAMDVTRAKQTNFGAYVMGDFAANEKLSLALRVGVANKNVNPYVASIEGGAVYRGPCASRGEDLLGLGFATALSTTDQETALELSYLAVINEHVNVIPDLQYVINPGLSGNLDNAWVTSVRGEFSW